MTSSLALVGAGVRGTAALGRLAARLRDAEGSETIDIHVIDPYPPGSGRIWRAGQARSLVMNTVAAQSTVFDDESLGFPSPMPGPNFAEWCAEVAAGRIDAEEEWIRRGAREIAPWASPSRAVYGAYLRWAFARFAASLPARAILHLHEDRAIALRPRGERYRMELASGRSIEVDAALLALGWLPRRQQGDRDISPDSPIDQGLEAVEPGERLAVRGIGMGFIDLLSLVTEERGGAFEPDPRPGRPDAVRYRPGDGEPFVFAGSRSGLPLLAKPAFGTVPPAARFDALGAAMPGLRGRPVDFAREVLPLVEHAAALEHYRALAEHRPEAFTGDPGRLFESFERGLQLGSTRIPDPEQGWRTLAEELVPDPSQRFDAERIGAPLRPAGGGRPTSADFDRATVARIEHDAADAALGHASPRKRGLHVYQAGRVAIVPATEFGAVPPEGRDALDRYLTLAGIAGSGPPLFRIEQLLALHRAGIVRFLGPELEIVETEGGRRARSARSSDVGEAIDRVVDARLDLPDPTTLDDPLLRSLGEAGLARIWAGDPVRPTIEIEPASSALVGADGSPVSGLHSVGPLHEQLRRFTIIAPIPGAGSTVLREIDAAVAAILDRASDRPAERAGLITQEQS